MIAGELDGGLTRTQPHRGPADDRHDEPAVRCAGIKFNMNGNADAFLIEGSDISQWTSRSRQWVQQEHHRAVRQDQELRLRPGDQHVPLSLTWQVLAGGGALE